MKRNTLTACMTTLIVSLTAAGTALADIGKQEAIDMALQLHPGKVDKAYQETKKGVVVWEVEIDGDDGNEWKAYYRVDNGDLFMQKKNGEEISAASNS